VGEIVLFTVMCPAQSRACAKLVRSPMGYRHERLSRVDRSRCAVIDVDVDVWKVSGQIRGEEGSEVEDCNIGNPTTAAYSDWVGFFPDLV
jgi:hypothetical protein